MFGCLSWAATCASRSKRSSISSRLGPRGGQALEADGLDRDHAAEDLVLGLVDRAEGARAELLDDLVAAGDLGGLGRGRAWLIQTVYTGPASGKLGGPGRPGARGCCARSGRNQPGRVRDRERTLTLVLSPSRQIRTLTSSLRGRTGVVVDGLEVSGWPARARFPPPPSAAACASAWSSGLRHAVGAGRVLLHPQVRVLRRLAGLHVVDARPGGERAGRAPRPPPPPRSRLSRVFMSVRAPAGAGARAARAGACGSGTTRAGSPARPGRTQRKRSGSAGRRRRRRAR